MYCADWPSLFAAVSRSQKPYGMHGKSRFQPVSSQCDMSIIISGMGSSSN